MKFTVIRSRFLELLSSVQSVVPNKPALQIISNAMVDAQEDGTLTLTATDLDVSVRSTLSADVKVDEPGAVTLPVRKLIEVLRNAPEGEVSFDWHRQRGERPHRRCQIQTHRAGRPRVPGDYRAERKRQTLYDRPRRLPRNASQDRLCRRDG